MRILSIIFLALSLPAMAQGTTSAPQQKGTVPPPKDEVVESTTLCDPHEETQMPETFY